MVKDGNENNLNHNGEKPGDSPEMKKYQKEKREAIDAAKKLESELAQKLEDHEMNRENTEAQELIRKNDFPEVRKSRNDNPEQEELQRMFEAIKTDHIEYPFFRRIFPNFIRVCENSRLWQSYSRDVLGLALGIGESLVSVVKLSGHLIMDTVKVVFQPMKSLRETKEIVS